MEYCKHYLCDRCCDDCTDAELIDDMVTCPSCKDDMIERGEIEPDPEPPRFPCCNSPYHKMSCESRRAE